MYTDVYVCIYTYIRGFSEMSGDLDISEFVVKKLKLPYCSQFSESVSTDSEKTETLQTYLILKKVVCLGDLKHDYKGI